MSEYDTEAQSGTAPPAAQGSSGGLRANFQLSTSTDTRYIRSLEGIVKLVSLVSYQFHGLASYQR